MFSRRVLLAAIAVGIGAAQYVSGPQVVTFLSDVDDTDQPYGLYLPKGYDPARKYPLVISLHDVFSNHRLNLRRVFGRGNRSGESDAEATRYWPQLRDVEYIVATPLARGAMGYKGIAEKDVFDVLADVKKRFSIDEDRIYLTGLSVGGGGSLWIGLTRPDIWAAIAAVCPFPPPGTDELAGNAVNVPVKLFQGEVDPTVTAASTRAWQQRLVKAGVKSEYVEYPGIRHNSWDIAYRDGAIFDWFSQFRRVHYPEKVEFATRAYKYSKAYWVKLDLLTPGDLARISARFTAKKTLTITTEKLDAFTLQLKGHPMAAGPGALSITIDGAALHARAADSISLSKTSKGWTLAAAKPESKRAGAEGPIADAISHRQIYIYGTGGSPSDDELQRRKAVAQQAAEWSTPRQKLLLTFRVLSDTEAQSFDLQNATLMLFGTKETNSFVRQYANMLPMSLNAGAADYGLIFTYPIKGRYVVIHSGLPWWSRFEQTNRFELPFLTAPYQTLMTLGDYVVFRGGLDNVLAEGRFDRNWKLPAAEVEKIRATGAIEVK